MDSQTNTFQRRLIVGLSIVLLALTAVAGIYAIGNRGVNHQFSGPPRQAIVDVTANGFVPMTLHVKAGTVIQWHNTDDRNHQVASNPYPADNGTPGLKSTSLLPNGIYTYTVLKPATINYHDETDPTHNGQIVVEP